MTQGNESMKTKLLLYCVTLSPSSLKLYTFSLFTQLNFYIKRVKKKNAGLIVDFADIDHRNPSRGKGAGGRGGRSAAHTPNVT